MQKIFRYAIVGLLLCCFNHPAQAQDAANLEARVAALEKYVNELTPQLNDFTRGLYHDLDWRMKTMSDKVAVLNLVSQQFSRVSSNAGDLLVSIDRRERLGNGYRLVIKIGNPHAASFGDIRLRLYWGKNWDPKNLKPTYEEWRNSLTGAEYSFAGPLEPGMWTEVTVDLAYDSALPFEYIECEMQVGSIKLTTK
jgi:hypothetical protein